MELTSDSKNLIVNPQHLLYYVHTKEDEGDDERHSVDIYEEKNALADTTIDSIESRTSTRPERAAEEIIPDFAIIRIKYGLRDMELKKTWDNVKIRHTGVPLLAENKRSGRRSLAKIPFLKSTSTFISSAQRDLVRQAAYLFTMHLRQQSVVLVACSGIYWSCMAADREYVLDRVAPTPGDDFIEVDGEDSGDETPDEDYEGEEEMVEGDLDELDLINEHESLQVQSWSSRSGGNEETEEMYLEPTVAEENLQIPENKWSQLLRLDSKASNQKMFLIHSRLRAVARDATGAMG
jgi:hypothetical protein